MPHWFEPLADHVGSAYLRYSFTRGTAQEVEFLVRALGLAPGDLVLDVGCGPGRHAHALAERGIAVVGIDVSQRFVELASRGGGPARFLRLDARELVEAGASGRLPRAGEFDAVISLCQGGFGLLGGGGGDGDVDLDGDERVLAGMISVLRPGGKVVLSASNAYFVVRFLEDGEDFDAATGVSHEHTAVRDEKGIEADFEMWTTCFTPRELRLLAERAGLVVDDVWSVGPGRYAARPVDLSHPELLLLARLPGAHRRSGGTISGR
ncbi:MAG: class I SAM-dependent methyltransferase [Acidimicrobiales bacterium]